MHCDVLQGDPGRTLIPEETCQVSDLLRRGSSLTPIQASDRQDGWVHWGEISRNESALPEVMAMRVLTMSYASISNVRFGVLCHEEPEAPETQRGLAPLPDYLWCSFGISVL